MSGIGISVDLEQPVQVGRTLGVEMCCGSAVKERWIAFAIAVVLHGSILLVRLPALQRDSDPPAEMPAIVITRWIPGPTGGERPLGHEVVDDRSPELAVEELERQDVTDAEELLVHRVPLSDLALGAPEPVDDPQGGIATGSASGTGGGTGGPPPPEIGFLIGMPEAPPTRAGPLIAGTDGVTMPERIAESFVKPRYPQLARAARLEGQVVIQAVILKDGTVGELAVLRCDHPNVGFELSALEAVQQWRYRPAMQGTVAVDVLFTVIVDFELS